MTNTKQIQINLTIQQIYKVLRPECQDKLLNLVASEGVKKSLIDNLKEQLVK